MSEPAYTVFVRVPIPRGDFVDPPFVQWDTSKDVELWNIVSDAAQTEIDWNELFDATVSFLLQQVAYLTNRHASQVHAQVRKATAATKNTSAAPSPAPGGEQVSSPLGHRRTASALSLRRDSPVPAAVPGRHDTGTPVNTTNRSNLPRNTSGTTLAQVAAHNLASMASREGTGTVTPSRGNGNKGLPPPPPRSVDTQAARARFSSPPVSTPVDPPGPDPAESEPASEDSDDDSSSDDDSPPVQSRIISRPPIWDQQKAAASFLNNYGEDDDEEESVFKMPAKSPSSLTQQDRHPSAQDLTATLRGPVELAKIRSGTGKARQSSSQSQSLSQTSDSSMGSVSVVARPGERRRKAAAGSLSPSSAAEMTGRGGAGSHRAKGRGVSREGSGGTPSTESSFSDLEEGSVTRSAIEEYMMQESSMAGRFSLAALRSRYGGGGGGFSKPS